MGPFFFDTLRGAVRMPATWVLCGLGLLSGWAGLSLAILALGEIASQAHDIVVSTAHAFGAFTALWIAATIGAEDGESAFALSAECTRPGRVGRLVGRTLGSAGFALVVIYIVFLGLSPAAGFQPASLSLLVASSLVAVQAAAWGSLFSCSGRSGLAVLAGLVAWFLGHLPWGSPALLPGPLGRAVAAWLPGPRDPSRVLAEAGYTLPAAVATVCLAWVVAPRREPGD